MKHFLYLMLLFGICFFQCKEKIVLYVEPNRSGLESFSVPGIDQENIQILDNVIVINLPDNFRGNFIKPDLKLADNFTTTSEAAIDGFEFEGKNVTIRLYHDTWGIVNYQICVIPSNPIQILDFEKTYDIHIDYNSKITIPFAFLGTSVTVNDSGKVVFEPVVDLINNTTGDTLRQLETTIVETDTAWQLSSELPATIPVGEYSAVIKWGTKMIKLSKPINIKPGPLRMMRGSWLLMPEQKSFAVAVYNISKQVKYEMIISNDYVQDHRIPLTYKDAGMLTGNFPTDIPLGNYKARYIENGNPVHTTDYKIGIEKYLGDDNFYYRKYPTQPILRIISKPSLISSFQAPAGFPLDYYKPAISVDTSEPLIAHIQTSGPSVAKYDLVLVSIETNKEYVMNHTGDLYRIFDGITFLTYNLNNNIPKGKYGVYAVVGAENEKSEKYSQIINVN